MSQTRSARVAAIALAALGGCTDLGIVDGPSAADQQELESLHRDACGRDGSRCGRDRFVRVGDTYVHYREAGDPNGPPIVLLHGQPTWSYLYRNIIPSLPPNAHVIAPDAVGYGFSGKPDIEYTWQQHVDYMDAFLSELGLKDMILVVHDFGSFEGLAYAANHPDNVRGLVMMESIVQPFPSIDVVKAQFPPGSKGAEFADLIATFRSDPVAAHKLVVEDNVFVEQILQQFTVRRLTRREIEAYRIPFRSPQSREKLLSIPLGIPFGGDPPENAVLVGRYAQWLAGSSIPKLIVYSDRGLLFAPPVAAMLAQGLPNTTAVSIGDGFHFIQEDHPIEIAAAISSFFHQVWPGR